MIWLAACERLRPVYTHWLRITCENHSYFRTFLKNNGNCTVEFGQKIVPKCIPQLLGYFVLNYISRWLYIWFFRSMTPKWHLKRLRFYFVKLNNFLIIIITINLWHRSLSCALNTTTILITTYNLFFYSREAKFPTATCITNLLPKKNYSPWIFLIVLTGLSPALAVTMLENTVAVFCFLGKFVSKNPLQPHAQTWSMTSLQKNSKKIWFITVEKSYEWRLNYVNYHCLQIYHSGPGCSKAD